MSLVERANAIRNRLRNPPNAVVDFGIDLSRKSIPKTIPVVCLDQGTAGIVKHKRRKLPPYIVKRRYPRIDDITDAVCAHFGVSFQDIESNRREVRVTHPRQVACYLARLLTPLSLTEIARLFGDRDHTTILHASRKIERLIESDAKVCGDVDIVKREIHKTFVLRNNLYCFDEREV